MGAPLIAAFGAALLASPVLAADPVPGPDSMAQAGVPKGEVLKFSFEKSKIFPGTYRDYWVYIPAQYTPDKPACLYVNQDGVQWNAPTVFDNLIAKKEMPITIGVFVMHGRVKAENGEKALDRFNRSFEYDGLGDDYARFLIEELLPDVETRRASDGRAIRISKEGKDRAIGGASSGAVCAFTAAWERPDSFSRVFSAIGTYVGLRGADDYPDLIRKYEPKPIRIYLQDGSNDLNIYGGDWWTANLMMERALTFAGYEVEHSWGEGGHSGNHGTAIFPDAMRFLWKGWPAPVGKGESKNTFLQDLLIEGRNWEVASANPATNLIATPLNHVIATLSGISSEILGASPDKGNAKGIVARCFGADKSSFSVSTSGKVRRTASLRESNELATDLPGNDLVATSTGNLFVSVTGDPGKADGQVWVVRFGEKKRLVESGLQGIGGMTVSPDETLLYVSEARTRWVYSYKINADGTVSHKQRYYWLHCPDDDQSAGGGGMCVDTDGRLYVATAIGIQICDQAGRVNCILPVPGGAATDVTLTEDGTLYAAAGGVYRRALKSKPALVWNGPSKPAAPRL